MEDFTMTKTATLALLAGLVAAGPACPRPAEGGQMAKVPAADQAAIHRWQDMRFGMFIHWGPVSLKGTEIGWSRGRQVPKAEYDQLYLKFNPTRFDADRWVRLAKDAGMKYLVITSKHHDGFCLWDSKLTDYDIMSTPLKRDVLKELSAACKRQGILFCTYYSILDWHHPDYPTDSPGGRGAKPHPNMDRYVAYMKGQLRELVEGYGPLGILWFDGEWEKPWTHQRGLDLYAYVRSLQKGILVNNRVDKGRRGMKGVTASEQFAGDYDTPEQQIGGFNRQRPWETCMTICRQWAWKPNDRLKSLRECVRTLVATAGGDGNLLLNVGPMPDGRIEPRQAERLRQIGQWLRKYGEGIYGTRGGPFKPGKWGASTCKDDRIYLFVTDWPAQGPLELPAIGRKIVASKTLSGGKAAVRKSNGAITVEMAKADRDPMVTVICITVDGKATEIPPVAVP
jgi:alpha-L-fucosidase